MKTKIFLLIILLVIIRLIFCPATALCSKHININGPGFLTGYVVVENSDLPMDMVNVVLYSAADSSMVVGTITNMDGSFTLSMIETGDYFLKIDTPGFEKTLVPKIQVQNNLKINLEKIHLTPIAETRKKFRLNLAKTER
jgi:hypothetical protein